MDNLIDTDTLPEMVFGKSDFEDSMNHCEEWLYHAETLLHETFGHLFPMELHHNGVPWELYFDNDGNLSLTENNAQNGEDNDTDPNLTLAENQSSNDRMKEEKNGIALKIRNSVQTIFSSSQKFSTKSKQNVNFSLTSRRAQSCCKSSKNNYSPSENN